ncbi:hypothetical protein EDB84DRAFT_1506716 [Lactarius hengduanensis]|nr:hypothetical protein EDB84DRAFT_1506716 [Lactarius hengduanensis]
MSQAAPPQPRKPEIASLGEPQKRKYDIFVSSPRDVVRALNHAVFRRGSSYRIEAGRRPLECQRRCAHAVHGLRGCAAPSGTLEVRVFRENECPLCRKGGVIVERDTDVTGGLRHDWYEERVESERSLLIYLGLGESSAKDCEPAYTGSSARRRAACVDSQSR